MKLKFDYILLVFVFIQTASSRKCGCRCPPEPSTIVVIQNLATPDQPITCGKCDQLILPPIQAELPQGLGYLPSAVPYVASCFEPAVEIGGKSSGANIPVMSPYSCLTLAAPISPEWAPLVRPLIL